jgi:hypothetical protein
VPAAPAEISLSVEQKSLLEEPIDPKANKISQKGLRRIVPAHRQRQARESSTASNAQIPTICGTCSQHGAINFTPELRRRRRQDLRQFR